MSAADQWTILRVLDWTRGHFESKGITSPRLDAEVLIAHALKMERVMLYAHFDRPLAAEELAKIRQLVAHRARLEPIAHLVGKREFWSMPFEVDASVLIPRPDTEQLVELGLTLCPDEPVRIADIGTGSGCVLCALAKERPQAALFGVDIDPSAIAIARRNVIAHHFGDRVHLEQGDLITPLIAHRDGPFDLIVANLPYIPSADIDGLMDDVRLYEPRLALDGGKDGLDLIRRFIHEAPAVLQWHGAIALEADPAQIEAIAALCNAGHWREVETHQDLAKKPRFVSARRPSA